MSDKTFTVVGTSVKNGDKKLRLANGTAEARQKVLEKDNHSEVRLFDLPSAMSAADAEAWLRAQGDAVPERKAPEAKPAATPRARTTKRMAAELAEAINNASSKEIAHEELGLAASGMSREYWDSRDLVTRQEMSRNAAWKAGIDCPRGTYPELDMWLEMEGIFTRPDGTVQEAA